MTDTRNNASLKDLVTLTVDADGDGGDEARKITSTDAHLYWLPDFGRWVKAEALKSGMWLRTSSGTWVQITAVEHSSRHAHVYNLTVDGVHSYYVAAGAVPVLVHNENGCGPDGGGDAPAAPDPKPSAPKKADEELLADAKKIHEQVRVGKKSPEDAEFAFNKMTVSTGEFNGELVYTVNRNKTSPAIREMAEKLEYKRIFGRKFTGKDQTDAEQIMMNAVDQGRLPANGRAAPSRPACGPNRQNCRARIGNYPDINLIE
ncbi:polymorphic toxin-type HINT domain-containing protein [Streptomyces sp. NPDC002133]|uniref:polymorphic toxin-type HINT domain-containing protein n=1 Tax=Streptomyces sp. NPDC002133 TaxID=3154409 RepID=UPI00332C6124